MRYALFVMLLACGGEADDTAVEEVEEVVDNTTTEEAEEEQEVIEDECLDGEAEDRDGIMYICEEGQWVEQSTEEEGE